MTVAAHLVGGLGDLHAITMEQRRELTPEEAQSLILGTQWFCAGVATYVLFIWILKLNMLFLYQRIVNGLWVAKFIKPTMGLVVATLFAIMMILFCSCRPYNRMWMVYPDQGGEFVWMQSPSTTADPTLPAANRNLQASSHHQPGTGPDHEYPHRHVYHGHPSASHPPGPHDHLAQSQSLRPLRRRHLHHDRRHPARRLRPRRTSPHRTHNRPHPRTANTSPHSSATAKPPPSGPAAKTSSPSSSAKRP